jgi:hypothetical protein
MVTNCYDDSRDGSLRTVIGGAADGDTIDLRSLPGSDPACTASKITLTQGQIPVTGTLTVIGPGQAALAIDGNDASVIFTSSDANGSLTLRDITVTDGHNTSHRGGCIELDGALTLDGAAVTDCTLNAYGSTGKYPAIFAGGGIFASTVTLQNGANVKHNTLAKNDNYFGFIFGGGLATSYLYCTDSTISGNVAELSSAGGAYVSNTASLVRCTVDNNVASGAAGGLYANGPTTIDESTFSHNAAAIGGAILSKAALTISNSTIAFNTAISNYAAGIDSTEDVTLQSTIVGDSANQGGAPIDIRLAAGKRIFGSANLVMYTSAPFVAGAIVSFAAPRLAPLGERGGLTRTHATLTVSPAIDAGMNPSHDDEDQRGATRESPTSKPDIGAYERQSNDDELFYDGFDDT